MLNFETHDTLQLLQMKINLREFFFKILQAIFFNQYYIIARDLTLLSLQIKLALLKQVSEDFDDLPM